MTPNFSFYEFRPKGRGKSWRPNNEYQRILVRTLAENLQVVRSAMPKMAYMKVTSGVRELEDYDRLREAGYKPSKTSDHNCGVSIKLDPGSRKFQKFGSTYNFSIGAGDIVPVGMKVWDLFKLSFRLTKEGMCNFGQVIYEKNPANGWEWIHYGNDPAEFFSKEIVEMINRQKFMQSLNGGKSYTVVNSI